MAEFPGLTLIDNPVATRQSLAPRLTTVFPVRDVGAHEILSGISYEIDYCGFDTTGASVDFDNYDDCIRTAEKNFDEGLLFVNSFPVGTLYQALRCRPGFGTGGLGEYEVRARNRLLALETTYLEKALETRVLAGTNATAVTAGADLVESIAALVSQNIDNPTLHISVENAVLLGTALENIAIAGVSVVISPVYSDATAFLTGPVTVWGGPIEVHSAPDMANNYVMAIGERQYIMAVEPAGDTDGDGDQDCKPFKVTLP